MCFLLFLVLLNTTFLPACSGQVSEVLAWRATLQLYLTSPIPSPTSTTTLSPHLPCTLLQLFRSSTLFLFPPSIFPHHSRSWVNLYCILNKGEIGFYKDAKNTGTPYNNEPLLSLSHCHCDITNGYKKKKNVFTLKWESFLMKTLFFCTSLFTLFTNDKGCICPESFNNVVNQSHYTNHKIVSSFLEHQISWTVFKIFCSHSRTKDGSEFLFHAKDEVRNSILIICLMLFSSSHRLSEVSQ